MRKNTRTPRPTGRRSPLASVALLVLGLLTTGGTYALFTTTAAAETTEASQQMVDEGEKLFASNCASCHGLNAEGSDVAPSLIGAGAASVDFQVGTGRMPLAAQGPQGEEKPIQFAQEQIDQMAAWVASLAPGPAIPDEALLQADGDATNGAELFRINCAMCHNVAGAGGALTEGKWAPSVQDVSGKHIYEAMVTGPSNMPVFNDLNLTPEDKRDIITYLVNYASATSPGGIDLGDLGPVAEGLFLWIFGIGAIIGITIWLTAKSN
jgi:ubiquinol-cytochrome c reductase cytochrome c subunit